MRRVEFWIVVAVLGVMTMSAAASQQGPKDAAPLQSGAGANAGSATPKSASADPHYIIGAQDVLDISVWKEDQLTKTVPVRPDGKISIPLLNDVQAAGLTPTQLAMQITESLKKFVTDPQVTVIVREINSQRVYLLGEVTRAGAYPLLPGMTVLQGLSSAGGFTQFANLKKIYVLRVENGKQEKFPFNYKHALESPDQNILLKAGDTIVVP
jgi:polysaccharide export outer membrane protein